MEHGRFRSGCFLLLMMIPAISALSSVQAAVTEKGEARQPRNIYGLVYAFQHTFERLLKPYELKLYETHTPKEIQQINPELYDRISTDVKRWTDEWIQHIQSTGDPIPEKRLSDAQQLATRIEGMLAQYFKEKGWTSCHPATSSGSIPIHASETAWRSFWQ